MQTSEIIEIIKGKNKLTKEQLKEVNDLMLKYPYFETLYNIYIRNSFKSSTEDFEKSLVEYSLYINNREKMVNDVFEENEKIIKKLNAQKNEAVIAKDKKEEKSKEEANVLEKEDKTEKTETEEPPETKTKKEKRKKASKDEDIFDPELYERQKVAHKLIVEDFVTPKAEIFGDLRKGLKEENISEDDFWTQLQDDAKNIEKQNTVIDEKIEKVTENKIEDQKTEVKEVQKKENITEKKSTNEEKQKITENNIVDAPEIKEEKQPEKIDNDKPEKQNDKEDIFAKIARLKSKKLADLKQSQEKTETVVSSEDKENEVVENSSEQNNDAIDVEKSQQEVKTEEKITENTEIVNQQEVEPENTSDTEEIEKTEQETKLDTKTSDLDKAENKSIVEEKVTKDEQNETIEIVDTDNNKTSDNSSDETIEKEPEKELSAADKILLKLKNKKDVPEKNTTVNETKPKVSADEILEKLKGEKNKEIKEETVVEQNDIVETKENDKVEKEIIKEEFEVINNTEEAQIETKEIIEDKIDDDLTETISTDAKIVEETKEEEKEPVNEVDPKPEKKKSAADLLLEKINQRKNTITNVDVIDKFLTDQPYIDRKKEPENTTDLSVPSSKENEVVTERIAEIYALQGLNEKAITTYEKLILKYPEKNAYFASKIQELKNK